MSLVAKKIYQFFYLCYIITIIHYEELFVINCTFFSIFKNEIEESEEKRRETKMGRSTLVREGFKRND